MNLAELLVPAGTELAVKLLIWFAMCSERASMLRLNVDATLAVPVLLKMMCSSPCVGAANVGFFSVKERR